MKDEEILEPYGIIKDSRITRLCMMRALEVQEKDFNKKIRELKDFIIKEWNVNYRPARIMIDKIDEIFGEVEK